MRVILVAITLLALPILPTLWNSCLAASLSVAPQVQDREVLLPRDDEEKAVAAFFGGYLASHAPPKPGDTRGVGPITPPPPPPHTSEFETLRSAVCATDVIVSGRATKSRVFFNSKETFLVTTYEFRTDRWLRPLTSSAQKASLGLALPGGEAVIDGKLTKAMANAELPTDRDVVLWLRKIKDTSIYTLARHVGILIFDGDLATTALPTWIPALKREDSRANILTDITNAAATCGTAW